jgi:7-cyano-7-deazaguanine reductase
MQTDLQKTVEASAPLGQKSAYPKGYDKSLLHPVRRADQRAAMAMPTIKWLGADLWNAYELAWLNQAGKPVRACATFSIPADSTFLAESKSVKLYLNSLNHTRFLDGTQVADLIARDLSAVCEAPINVELNPPSLCSLTNTFTGFESLDDVNVDVSVYERDPKLLVVNANLTEEKLVSHLFKSHCLVTGQPDWGSIFISYRGPEIDRASLLKYLISYHNHSGFSENCIEQIFVDLLTLAKPERLEVFGRFTRRGGIDINPYRANVDVEMLNGRLIYQ